MKKDENNYDVSKILAVVILVIVGISGCFFVLWQMSSQKSAANAKNTQAVATQKEIDELNQKIDELNASLQEVQNSNSDDSSGTVKGDSTSSVTDKININTASLSDLDKLDGIGPTYAQRIIDYRSANNGFKSIEEIKNVKGIGDKTFEKLKNQITI